MTTTRPGFNRTSNSTMLPPTRGNYTFNGTNDNWMNNSNYSNFGGMGGNNSGPNMIPFDESPEVMFYLLSTLLLPSLLCFLFLLYNLIRLPKLRNKSNNFFIIILLLINFVHLLADLPFRLYFLQQNQVLIRNPTFCLIWTCYDHILTTVDLFIMAFTSLERYLSIFHHRFLHRFKYFIYKIPVVVCFFIPTVWYTVLTFAYPCRQLFMYFTFQCGTLCYLSASTVFLNIENIAFFMFPLFIIVVGNATLIISVLIQKANMRRRGRLRMWRSNLRMISQLVFIGILYMSIYIPSCVLLIFGSYVRRNRFQPWAESVRIRYFTHLKYLIIYGCPFVILVGQRELRTQLVQFFCRRNQCFRMRLKTQIIPMSIAPTT